MNAASDAPEVFRFGGQNLNRYRIAYLSYLLLYPVPWFIHHKPTPSQLLFSFCALLVFLPLYFSPYRRDKTYGLPEIIMTAFLGFATAWTHGDWLVYNIYATGMSSRIRKRSHSIATIILLQCALLSFCYFANRSAIEATVGVILSLVTYVGTWMQWELGYRNQQLQEAQHEIRTLAATAERERIARDMHDLLGHSLTVISVKAELAERLFLGNPERAQREIADITQIARTSLHEVRQAVSGMNGTSLQQELTPTRKALEAAGIALTIQGEQDLLDKPQSSVLAMALREAITNVIRHSNARRCMISFECDPEGHALAIKVEDDGKSSAPVPISEGNGLQGMRARLAAAGGSLSLHQTHSGLTLKASIAS